MNPVRGVVLIVLRGYQRGISPLIPPRCRYHPSCSAYAVEAIERFGILRGGILASWRLLRCNPWSHGGYDPVAAQSLFKPHPTPDNAPASSL
jgi:putative membrane protein insertion efficiency factor